MHDLFSGMTATLSQAQQTVESELEQLTRAPVLDMSRLAHLGRSVRELSHNADSLLVMMLERDADVSLMNVVEVLVDFFRDTNERISTLLGSAQGSGLGRQRAEWRLQLVSCC